MKTSFFRGGIAFLLLLLIAHCPLSAQESTPSPAKPSLSIGLQLSGGIVKLPYGGHSFFLPFDDAESSWGLSIPVDYRFQKWGIRGRAELMSWELEKPQFHTQNYGRPFGSLAFVGYRYFPKSGISIGLGPQFSYFGNEFSESTTLRPFSLSVTAFVEKTFAFKDQAQFFLQLRSDYTFLAQESYRYRPNIYTSYTRNRYPRSHFIVIGYRWPPRQK